MRLSFIMPCLLLMLSGCNWTSQLDRDAGLCIVLTKTAGGACTVTIPPASATP